VNKAGSKSNPWKVWITVPPAASWKKKSKKKRQQRIALGCCVSEQDAHNMAVEYIEEHLENWPRL